MTTLNSGDTAFMLVAAALVLFMTPGLAFFYGGLVRSKNVVNTMMMSFVALAVVSVQWIVCGYSLSFNPNMGSVGTFLGGLGWIGLDGVSQAPNPDYAATIPHLPIMVYQAMSVRRCCCNNRLFCGCHLHPPEDYWRRHVHSKYR